MAKHSAPQTVAVVPTGTTIIRPIAVSAETYLGRLRAMAGMAGMASAAVAPVTPLRTGRHAR